MTYTDTNRVSIAPGSYPGLTEAIAAAGHALECNNGAWYASNATAVQAIIDSYVAPDLLAVVKAEKCAAVSAHAKMLRDKAVAAISAGEMASWGIKLSEAVKFGASGDPAQCPMLSAEASARGVTLAALVAKVGGNGQSFSYLEANIGGTDGKHRDAISALTTVEAVAAYDFSAGWLAV